MYFSWTFEGSSYNIDNWYIDDIKINGYSTFEPEYEDNSLVPLIEPGEEPGAEADRRRRRRRRPRADPGHEPLHEHGRRGPLRRLPDVPVHEQVHEPGAGLQGLILERTSELS